MNRHALVLCATLLAAAPAPLFAAPVPRLTAPPLSAADMVGTWRYWWWAEPDAGRITLHADGTYTCDYGRADVRYVGTWRIDGPAVVLEEWTFHPETGETDRRSVVYRLEIVGRDAEAIEARSRGGRVSLFDRAP